MPARSPAARRLTAAEQRLPLLGLGSELGVGFRAGGVRKSKLAVRSRSVASDDRCISLDEASCARSADAGII
eukprot:scaffold105526_cov108-Phaeocystis_antarctica.AAC.1